MGVDAATVAVVVWVLGGVAARLLGFLGLRHV